MAMRAERPTEGEGGQRPGAWATTPARRRRILDAALHCFDEKGSVASTTMEEICAAADLSVGSVYHHFSGKEDIFDQLVDEAMAEYLAGIVVALEEGSDLADSVGRLVRFHVGWLEKRPALTRLMLRWEEAERGRPSGQQHYDQYSGAIGAWLQREVREGRIRRMEPDLYSALLMGPLMEYARQRTAGLTTAPRGAVERGLVVALVRVLER